MTVAITGAAGHVGANLVRELVSSGRPVRALSYHDRRALEGRPVHRVDLGAAKDEGGGRGRSGLLGEQEKKRREESQKRKNQEEQLRKAARKAKEPTGP